MRYITTEGIILKRIPYQNEKVQLFSVLTKDLGKITLSARSQKKIGRSHSFNLLNVYDFQLYVSSQGYYKVKNHNLISSFHPEATQFEKLVESSHSDLKITQLIYGLVEIIDSIIHETHPDKELYNEFLKACMYIQKTADIRISECFKIKLLSHLGHMPRLTHCGNCNAKLYEHSWVSPDDLGIYCNSCVTENPLHTMCTEIDLDTLKLLSFIPSCNLKDVLKIKMSKKHLFDLHDFSTLLLNNSMERELKTQNHSLIPF